MFAKVGSLTDILNRSPPPPTPLTDYWLNRLEHRYSGQAAVHNSIQYKVARTLWPFSVPQGPAPERHRFQSKRSWERAMQDWRRQLQRMHDEAMAWASTSETMKWLGGPEWALEEEESAKTL